MRYPDPGDYLALCKRAFAVTAAGGLVRLHWNGNDLDLHGWQQEFRRALNRRITGGASPNHRGRPMRKLDALYQTGLLRDRRRIDDYARHRIVHPCNRLETPELQKRFLWHYDEDGLDIRLARPA